MSSTSKFSFGKLLSSHFRSHYLFPVHFSYFSIELPEIFKWRNPIESGIALLSLNLIYLSCLIQNAGIIYILTNYSFWFVISAAVYLKVKSLLAGSGASAT